MTTHDDGPVHGQGPVLGEGPVHGRFAEINPASPVSQRWWQRRHSWTRRHDGGFDAARYHVAPIPDAVAKSYVQTHHYSGAYVAAVHRFGLFLNTRDGADLVGVAVFSVPAQAKVLTNVLPDLVPYRESIELGRLVLEGPPAHTDRAQRAPGNAETWLLRRCYQHLADAGVAAVVSFADPVPRLVAGRLLFPGHVGTIYQASNALLAGRSTPRYLTVLPDGTSVSDRALQKVRAQDVGHDYVERRLHALGAPPRRAGQPAAGWLLDALNDVRAVRIRHPGCWRYVMFTSPAARRRARVHLPIDRVRPARAGRAGAPAYPKTPDPAPTTRPITTARKGNPS